ncbi:hypothetical protein TNCV_4338001 [Trichonephila clavipes]|uniref:Uncharacterized protein n=1 Tax=Trichonephila clavipes TaxID=2585209 RepID=A0A8X6SN64_TRICX|nr:hypothetical protein TNCV_4338001 [Trichonephila clavipes]
MKIAAPVSTSFEMKNTMKSMRRLIHWALGAGTQGPELESAFAEPLELESAFAEPLELESAFAEPLELESAFAEPLELESAFAEPLELESVFMEPHSPYPHFEEYISK